MYRHCSENCYDLHGNFLSEFRDFGEHCGAINENLCAVECFTIIARVCLPANFLLANVFPYFTPDASRMLPARRKLLFTHPQSNIISFNLITRLLYCPRAREDVISFSVYVVSISYSLFLFLSFCYENILSILSKRKANCLQRRAFGPVFRFRGENNPRLPSCLPYAVNTPRKLLNQPSLRAIYTHNIAPVLAPAPKQYYYIKFQASYASNSKILSLNVYGSDKLIS